MLDLNHLYLMDCMDGMAQFPDKYFDLAIVDPPYGININCNIGLRKGQRKKHMQKNWDSAPQMSATFANCFAYLKTKSFGAETISSYHHPEHLLFGTKRRVCTGEVSPNASMHGAA